MNVGDYEATRVNAVVNTFYDLDRIDRGSMSARDASRQVGTWMLSAIEKDDKVDAESRGVRLLNVYRPADAAPISVMVMRRRGGGDANVEVTLEKVRNCETLSTGAKSDTHTAKAEG